MYKSLLTTLLTIYFSNSVMASKIADTVLIKNHLHKITKTYNYRNHKNVETLNKVASYISETFRKYTDIVEYQEYTVNGRVYKNVIGSFSNNIPDSKTIIIGAHYDVCGDQEGADDNASGVVGLLELARLLKNKVLPYNIQLVAYTLEEPPFFDTTNMGSYVHAKSLINSELDVYGMISLEMIGYFSNEKKSQDYPLPNLSSIYGNKGDFITIVNKPDNNAFSKIFGSEFKKQDIIKTILFESSKSLPSIAFSDHLNYWKFGFDALMITDTAFFRNKNYHTEKDTMEKLNVKKMAQVIDSTYKTLINLE